MKIFHSELLVSLLLGAAGIVCLSRPLLSRGDDFSSISPRFERQSREYQRMRDEIGKDSWRYQPSSRANDFRAPIPYEPVKFRPKGPPVIQFSFPRDPAMPYYRRGKELFRQGKFAEAREQFLQALRLNPRKGECYSFLGQIYLEQDKNYVLAIEHFRKAVACCSSSTRHISLYYLALTYEAVEKTDEAMWTWEEYFQVCPKGTSWETEAKRHYAALKTAPVPAPTP